MDEDLQLPNFRTVRTTLIDVGDGTRKQEVKVAAFPLSIMLQFPGYDAQNIPDRQGYPVCVELRDDVLQVRIWSDINDQYPTHVISLENARMQDV